MNLGSAGLQRQQNLLLARMTMMAGASCLALFHAAPLAAAPTKVTYVSVVSDKNEPLEATAEKMPSAADKKPQRIGQTKLPKGELIPDPPIVCAQGERLHIYVEVGSFLGRTVECAARVVVILTSTVTMKALVGISAKAEKENNYGLAALAANEAAARLDAVPTSDLEQLVAQFKSQDQTKTTVDDSQLLPVYERELTARRSGEKEAQKHTLSYKRWTNVGKYLGVETPSYFDPVTTKFVMSPNTKAAITSYQAAKGLNASGQLDYSTLKDFAKTDLGNALDGWAGTKKGEGGSAVRQ